MVLWKSKGKNMKDSRKNHRKSRKYHARFVQKSYNNHGNIMKGHGKFLENLVQVREKSWKILRKVMKKSEKNHRNS